MWGNAVVISPHANQDGIIHFGCSWGYELSKGLYNFNHNTFPDEQTEVVVKEFQKRDIKKIGLIYNTTKGDYEVTGILKDKLEKAGIKVVWENIFGPEQRDFKSDISKVKDQDVDIVFIFMLDPGMSIYIKQAKELGFNPQYTTIQYFTYNPSLFEGLWYVTDAMGSQEFMDYFQKETGEKPDNSCVVNLYDIVNILIAGYEKATLSNDETIPNNTNVANTILNMDDLPTSGGEVNIDEEGNVHTHANLSIIKDGKSVRLEE
jgi:ABC-type branched-subunit amino acid transport system substrate-binding protein